MLTLTTPSLFPASVELSSPRLTLPPTLIAMLLPVSVESFTSNVLPAASTPTPPPGASSTVVLLIVNGPAVSSTAVPLKPEPLEMTSSSSVTLPLPVVEADRFAPLPV